jgi:CO/xanthine dehydrogenase Mo-binding subunit
MRRQPGELALVLHTHMPYVEGFGTWPFGEEWLWEAIATCYLPLLDVVGRAPITLSLTPVLCDQLEDPGAEESCLRFLREIRPETHRRDLEGFRTAGQHEFVSELERSAAEYAAAADRLEQLGGGLLGALGAHATWTSAATHAVLPLLASDSGIALQVLYEVPNVYCQSFAVYTNKIPTTAMRGFGYSESNWVLEQVFERAAKKLGMDSAKVRRMNLLRPGESHTATGEKLREDVGDPRKVLQAIVEEIKWGERPPVPSSPWKVRARGMALCVKGPSQPPNASSSAILRFNEDATADLNVATGNFGQGTVTALAQLVADQFGLPVERVRVDVTRDTSKSAYTWQTVGSRGLFTDGMATLRACEDAKRQVLSLASQVLKVDSEQLEVSEGAVKVKGRPWMTMPLKDLVFGYVYPNGNTIGGPVIGRGHVSSSLNTYLDPQTGQGVPTIFHTFGGTAVDVELDLVTGVIEVVKAVQAFDVGKVINPLLLKMQLDGGFIMGMSVALFEKVKFDEQGWVTNPNFTSYYIARMKDVPKEFVARFVETPQFDGPLGARGIGELSMISVASAISNAIYLATGVKLNNLPMSPEVVWAAISEQRPDLLAKAMDSFSGVETPVRVHS